MEYGLRGIEIILQKFEIDIMSYLDILVEKKIRKKYRVVRL